MMARTGPSLWPREHGAYAQLGVSLAAALGLAPVLAPAPASGSLSKALAQALLTVLLFLASEPLLVLLGRRGPNPAPGAGRRLALLCGLAAAAGAAAWARPEPGQAASLVPALVLGTGLFGLFLAKRERTAAGELVGALSFAAAALPVAVAGGAGPARAAQLAILLGAMLSLAMAAVHAHLAALRAGHGGPRLAAALLAVAVTAAASWAGGSWLPRHAFTVFLPMTLAALGIWWFPPAPRRLKAVGWLAAGCALAGAALALACFRNALG
jgi:hypothetical protein